MTPREIIAKHLCTMAAQGWSGISAFERAAYRTTAAGMVEAITSAGYRILGPDDLDKKTVERCAEVVQPKGPRPCDCERCDCRNVGDFEMVTAWDQQAESAFAIRALAKEKQGC